jgi:hypothetical protein
MHIRVVDRAIEIHGGMALTDDTPLAGFFAHSRAMRRTRPTRSASELLPARNFAGNGYEATTRQGVREMAGMDLNGKTALVTGDSRGIGHAAAERLADLGAKTNSAYGLLTEQQYSALPRHRAEHVEAQRCQPVGPGPSPSIRLCGNVSRAATDTARPGSGA